MSPGNSQARTAVLDPGTWTNDDINDDIKCSALKKKLDFSILPHYFQQHSNQKLLLRASKI